MTRWLLRAANQPQRPGEARTDDSARGTRAWGVVTLRFDRSMPAVTGRARQARKSGQFMWGLDPR